MGSIFIDLLSDAKDATSLLAKNQVNEIINTNACSELFDVLVINALGCRCPIAESSIDNAINYIITLKCNEIDNNAYNECDRIHEIQQWNDFYTLVGNNMKSRFRQSGLLIES